MSYSFPILPPNDIPSTLTNLGIQTSEINFKNPSPDLMESIYKQVVQTITCSGDILRDDQFQIPFEYSGSIENPELLNEAIKRRRLYLFCRKLMGEVGVRDFTMADIFRPEEKRSIRNLSGIINFLVFRENELSILQPHRAEYSRKFALCNQAENRKKELIEQVQAVAEEKKCDEHTIELWNEKIKEAKSVIAEKMNLVKEINEKQFPLLKDERDNLRNEIANKKLEKTIIMEEVSILKSNIVEPPEKLQQEVESLNAEAQKEKDLKIDIESKIVEYEKKIENIQKADKEIQASMTLLKEVNDKRTEYKDKSKSIKDLKTEISRIKGEHQTLTSTLERLKNEQNWKEKKQNVLRLEEKRQILIQRLNDLQTKKKMNAQQIENTNQQVLSLQEKTRSMEISMKNMSIQHEQKKQEHIAKYERLLDSVRSYNHRLADTMVKNWKPNRTAN